MERAGIAAIVSSLLLVPAAARAVDVPACKGAAVPSVPGGCAGVTTAGCCDTLGRALWCDGADLYCADCAGAFPHCGWNPGGYYDCGQAEGSSDPTGSHPRSCDPCPPGCASGAACSPLCHGGCGTCGAGAHCLDDGTCHVPECGSQQCGKDPKGFSCGVCPEDTVCVAGTFQCQALPPACVAADHPGCGGCGCEACVCAAYPWCCTENWDAFCAAACDAECGFDCSGCPPQPSCAGIECGDFCGLDCGGCGTGQVCIESKCCTRLCGGKQCGGDGCGGTCGTCSGTDDCVEGLCVPCQPKCAGRQCGDDGCGGSCGTCEGVLVCGPAGTCVESLCFGSCGGSPPDSSPQCYCDDVCFQYGDCCPGVCTACPELNGCCTPDCTGKACGDDGCGGSCGPCQAGTHCDAGACVPCTPDCTGKDCGDDGCNGSCGECLLPLICEGGVCTACQPQCAGKQCGDDGCGGVCGVCKAGLKCDGATCVEDPCKGYTYAGCCDGQALKYCDPSNPEIVVWDCAEAGPSCGWNAQAGYYDCNTGGTAAPGNSPPMECPACEASCAGKECGDDGCGGLCGECPAGGACEGGHCVVDACQGVAFVGCCAGGLLRWCSHGTVESLDCAADPACGWDPSTAMYDCGTSGGEDPSGAHPAACPACTPACGGRDCGDDGCGGACGFCSDGKSCSDGKCACTANVSAGCCNDAMCWIDSCGNAGEVIAQCPWGCSGFKCNECPDSGCAADPAVESGEAGPEQAEAAPDVAIAPDATDGLEEAAEWVYVEPSGGCGAGASDRSAWLAVAACGLVVLARRRGRAALLAAFAAVVACSGSSGADAIAGVADVAEIADAPAEADTPAWDLGHTEATDQGAELHPDPGTENVVDAIEEPGDDSGQDVTDDPDAGPDPADLAEAQEVDAPAQDAEDVGETDPGLPPYDCANLPKGPFKLVKVPGAIASEDLAFDSAGNLVGSDMSALYKTAAGKKAKLWVPGVQTRAGMRFIPSGTLMLNDDTLGRVLAFDPDGAMRVVVQGLSYPNGMAVDMKGFVYVTEHDAGRVLRIHPYTGEYTVLTTKIPNPNGIVFNPDYTALYIGSFGSGYVYKMSISPDGVPGKVVEWASPIGPGGLLDGMGVDACGNVYVCEYGGTDVYRIPPEGAPAVKIVHGDDTYLPNMQWGVGMGWDPYSLYLPDGWAVGLWRLEIGVPSAPTPYP